MVNEGEKELNEQLDKEHRQWESIKTKQRDHHHINSIRRKNNIKKSTGKREQHDQLVGGEWKRERTRRLDSTHW